MADNPNLTGWCSAIKGLVYCQLPLLCHVKCATEDGIVVIIRRYISLQILSATAAVTLVLTIILMSGRVIKYFGQAADGRLDVSLLTAILLYRLPGFLDLIIPLSFYIAILLTMGRLYLDNEMAVLSASGVSRAQIIGHLLLPAVIVMGTVAGTSLWLSPTGNAASDRLFAEQAKRNSFDMVRPGRFQLFGKRMLYVGSLSEDKQKLQDVRIFEMPSSSSELPEQILVRADSGRTERNEETGDRFLILEHGTRYEVTPGEAAVRELRFERYQMLMPNSSALEPLSRMSSFSTPDLYAKSRENPEALAEWMWRISLSLFVPTAMLLAFALSKVNPRQGRYLKLFPAILLYLGYVVGIGAARNAIEKGKAGEALIWGVHAAWFLLALVVAGFEDMQQRWQLWQTTRAAK